jgi:hypothetical protein
LRRFRKKKAERRAVGVPPTLLELTRAGIVVECD